MMKSSCFFLLMLLISTQLTAQLEDYQFKAYGFEDGLTHRNIYKILQDPDGFIWIATINGLNKFDGVNITNYSSNSDNHKIPFDFINEMAVDNKGNLWLASPNQFCKLDPKQNTYNLIQTDSAAQLKEVSFGVDNLFIDNKDQVWASTWVNERKSSFLLHVNSEEKLKDILHVPGNFSDIKVIQQAADYFIASNNRMVYQIDENGNKLQEYTLPTASKKTQVTGFQVDESDALWIMMNSGELFSKLKDGNEFTPHPINGKLNLETVVSSFRIEPSGDIWIAGNGVIWHYIKSENRLLDFSETLRRLTKNTSYFRQIFQDNQGVIWLASDFGVIKIVRANNVFKNYLSGGNENCMNGFCSMRGITGDGKGNIYFSYYNAIHKLNTKTNTLTPLVLKNKFSNLPFGLSYHNNALYTGNGLKVNLNNLQIDTLFKRNSIDKGVSVVDKRQAIWFGFSNNLYKYDLRTKKSRLFKAGDVFPLEKNEINYLHIGKVTNQLYVGTQTEGVIVLDKDRKVVNRFHTKSSSPISHDRILNIYEDNKGNIWLATANGLNRINSSNNKITHFTTKEGLPNNFINAILSEGDSCIWMSTDNGLSRYSIASNSFSNFSDKDGLPSNEFNRISCYKSWDGHMYFGGLNGVCSFMPENFQLKKEVKKAPNLLLTSFSKFNANEDSLHILESGAIQDNSLLLENADRFFTFNYALTDYKNPKSNQYSFLLEGFDEQWSNPSNNTFTRYNNIPAGDYVFRVKGASEIGNWHSNELAVPLTIKEAFYKTWWFLAVSLVFGLISIYSFFRYRLYAARKREKELENLVNVRTSQLQKEKQKSDDLLLNILPAETAEELKKFGKAIAKKHESVSVLFTDFKDFSVIAQRLEPEVLVNEIDYCFKEFDLIIEKFNLEKIKTIGDAYMCVGGIDKNSNEAAIDTVRAALEIQNFLSILANETGTEKRAFTQARIGIHTGPVVSGIVGFKKFAFDIWGDTVNTAARMESEGLVGKVNISDTTYSVVKSHFNCEHRGKITAKNKGEIDMYFVTEHKSKSNQKQL